MVAYTQATEVPMAVPFIWRNQQSSNWKTLNFITRASNLITTSVGKAGGSSCLCSVSQRVIVWRPWSVSMFVYMETASEVKSFALGGRRPRLARSSRIWLESLVWLGHKVTTRESW